MKIAWGLAVLSFGKNKHQIRFTLGMLIVIVILFSTTIFTINGAEPTMADFAAKHGGSNDYLIQLKDQQLDSVSSLFEFDETKSKIYPAIGEIDFVFPRIITPIYIDNVQIELFATDLEAEREKKIGFPQPKTDEEIDLVPQIINNGCIINSYYSKYGWQEGDSLSIDFGFGFSLNFTFIKFVDMYDGYPYGEYKFPSVLIDLNTLWNKITEYQIKNNISLEQASNFTGLCNTLAVGLKNTNNYYRSTDFEGSTEELIKMASTVKQQLGWEQWNIYYSKKSSFDASNQSFFALLIVNVFVTFTAVLFLAILIYNALTTSISEKIRDYGILQALGAKKSDIYKALTIEGLLYAITALIIGIPLSILLSYTLTQTILSSVMQNLFMIDFSFVILPESVLWIITLVIGVILVFSLIPGRMIYNYSIIQAIHPEVLMEEENFSIKKTNLKLSRYFASGFILLILILTLITLIPTLFTSMDLLTFITFVMILFFIGIIGLILISLNFIPILLKYLVDFFGRFNQKIHDVLKIGINRHQRRNKTTTLLLILSFTLLIFFLSFIRLMGDQIQANTQCIYGSDMYVESRYNYPLSESEVNEIFQIEGVEMASGLIHDLSNIARSYQYMANTKSIPELGFYIGDYLGISTIAPQYYAIDENFYRTIARDRILMKEGNFEADYANLFNLSSPCVFISEQCAAKLHVAVNENIKLYFFRDGDLNIVGVRVAGIFYSIPGAHFDYNAFDFSKVSEIILSYDLVASELHLPMNENAIYSRILINYQDNAKPEQMQEKIYDYYSNNDNHLKFKSYYESFNSNATFLRLAELIAIILFSLLFVMVLAGFNISSYAIFLERRMEIQIFRTVGLKNAELKKLFFLELFILLISNGIIGTIIGYLMAIVFTNISLMIFHSKGNLTFPIDLLFIAFGVCILILILLYNRLFNKKMISVLSNVQDIRRR